MKEAKNKFGFWSIVLLGINAIVGTGIFLLPNKAYAVIGSASLGVLFFDALLAGCIALCFAEAAGFFTRNGGPYLYAKHALGDFWGFEVGVLKWVVIIIAWATMSVGFATALGAAFPMLGGDMNKNIIASVIIILLTVLNLLGVDTSKRLNDLITVSKLVPLFAFICVGIFFVNGSNFTPVFLNDEYTPGSFAQAAVLLFFAYTGFEAIAVAAEDMDNPKKNLPRAIITVMVSVTVLYLLILGVCIGVMGPELASSQAPVQDAFYKAIGPVGMYFVLAGTLLSMRVLLRPYLKTVCCRPYCQKGIRRIFLMWRLLRQPCSVYSWLGAAALLCWQLSVPYHGLHNIYRLVLPLSYSGKSGPTKNGPIKYPSA